MKIRQTADGRRWALNEEHPSTDARFVVCRAVENGSLRHTCIIGRSALNPIAHTADEAKMARRLPGE